MPWDIFFRTASPDVMMQLDTGHAIRAGINPNEVLEILKRYPGRAITVHLKDYSSKTGYLTTIGYGDMKWKKFFSLCETIGGTEWYIVEIDRAADTAATRCINSLREMGL